MTDKPDLLIKVLQEQVVSKNALIHTIGMDRSSFYQLLRGKRPGTTDQIASILSQLELNQELTEQLVREYLIRKFGNGYQLYEQVDRWMKILSAADERRESGAPAEDAGESSGDNTCEALAEDTVGASEVHSAGSKADIEVVSQLRQLILEERDNPQGGVPLCLYIPVKFFSSLWMETDVPELLGAVSETSEVRILLGLDLNAQQQMEGKLELLFSFLFGLYHIRNFAQIVHCIELNHTDEDTPFPYFAAGRDKLFLMNEVCSRGLVTGQKDLVAEYRDFFTRLTEQPYEYLESYDSLEDFMGSLFQRFIANAGQDRVSRMVERRLCIFKVVNEEQIAHYAPQGMQEFLMAYLRMFRQMQIIFINSAGALQEFMSDNTVMENGIRITIDSADAETIRQQAAHAGDNGILFLSGSQDHLPRNWVFVLFSTGELIILPNWDCSHIISIRNSQLYQAFGAWFDVCRELTMVREKLADRVGEQ